MNGRKYKRKATRKIKKYNSIPKTPNAGITYMYVESFDVVASVLGTTSYQFNSSAWPYLNFSDMFLTQGLTSINNLFKNWAEIKILSLDLIITDAIAPTTYTSGTFGDSSFPTYYIGCYPAKQSYDPGNYTLFKDDAVYVTPGICRTQYKRFKFHKVDRMTGTATVGQWVDMSSNGSANDIKGELHVRTAHSHNTPVSVHVSNLRSRFTIACRGTNY